MGYSLERQGRMLQEDEMVGHFLCDKIVVLSTGERALREAALLRLHMKRKRRRVKKAQCLELVEDDVGVNIC